MKAAHIGLGYIGNTKHLPSLLSERRLRLVAIVDRNSTRVAQAARRFGVQQYYTDASKMLSNEQPDIVTIATPPQTHAELAIQAIESGAHVLIEKPMASNPDDAQRIIEVSNRHEKKLAVIHNLLYDRATRLAIHMARSGALGDVLSVTVDHKTILRRELPQWVLDLRGQLVVDEAVHMAYLILAFMNAENLTFVNGGLLSKESPVSVDHFVAYINDGQMVGQMTAMFSCPRTEWSTTIVGSKRMVLIDNLRDTAIVMDHAESKPSRFALSGLYYLAQQARDMGVKTVRFAAGLNAHRIAVKSFADTVVQGIRPLTSGEEGKAAVRLVCEIHDRLSKRKLYTS